MPLKKTMSDLVKEALRQIPEVDAHELVAMTEAREHPRPLVIDIREADERARGYIPGSVFIPRGVLERDIEKTGFGHHVSDDELDHPVVLYCAGGNRSALAAESLVRMGFTRVFSLEGGFKAWGDASMPVAHDRAG